MTRVLIPNAQMATLEHSGHFLPLTEAIIGLAGRQRRSDTAPGSAGGRGLEVI